jgi:hypothetical protein
LPAGGAMPLISGTHRSPGFIGFPKPLGAKHPKGGITRPAPDSHGARASKGSGAFMTEAPDALGLRLRPNTVPG